MKKISPGSSETATHILSAPPINLTLTLRTAKGHSIQPLPDDCTSMSSTNACPVSVLHKTFMKAMKLKIYAFILTKLNVHVPSRHKLRKATHSLSLFQTSYTFDCFQDMTHWLQTKCCSRQYAPQWPLQPREVCWESWPWITQWWWSPDLPVSASSLFLKTRAPESEPWTWITAANQTNRERVLSG